MIGHVDVVGRAFCMAFQNFRRRMFVEHGIPHLSGQTFAASHEFLALGARRHVRFEIASGVRVQTPNDVGRNLLLKFLVTVHHPATSVIQRSRSSEARRGLREPCAGNERDAI